MENIVIVILIACYEGNSDCYYGNGAASSDKICYCYTDTGAALSGLKRGLITKDAIECTPLEGGNYKVCNANCYEGNSDCYYGNGAASSDKICYCYTDTGAALSGLKRGLITKDALNL
eukprot:611755_1